MGCMSDMAASCAAQTDRFNIFLLLLVMVFAPAAQAAEAKKPSPLKSGIEFSSEDVRKLQADDFANPGMLWVVRGEKLWGEPAGKSGQSCATCHGDAAQSMKGVAARGSSISEGVSTCAASAISRRRLSRTSPANCSA